MPDSWDDPLVDDSPGTTEKPKFSADLATAVAAELCPLILPLCGIGRDGPDGPVRPMMRICGSLRRRKELVGDVEIVFSPEMRCVRAEERDLLGAVLKPSVMEPATHAALEDLVRRGVLTKRVKCNGALTGWGPWNRFATHVESGVPVDFFGCMEASFWNTVVCRTGGKRTNVRICEAAHAVGWNWEPSPEQAGFRRQAGLAIERHAVRSEREVFEFVKMPYLKPWERE